MSSLRAQIDEKRRILRDLYGGAMSLNELRRELGTTKENAKEWAREREIGFSTGARIKYETDEVAKAIVNARGMY